MVTASEKGTYIILGRDLATYIAPDANIELEALPSAGSSENVSRLRFEAGVKLALVQSDVYQAFLDQAAAGNKDAGDIISSPYASSFPYTTKRSTSSPGRIRRSTMSMRSRTPRSMPAHTEAALH